MKEQKEKTLLERFTPKNIDRRILFWILLITIITIYIHPIGIPVVITERTKAAYNFMENLAEGSIVFISIDTTGGGYQESGPSMRNALRHCIRNKLRVVIAGFWAPEATTLQEMALKRVKLPPDWEYGVNYITFGYIPGKEAAIAQLAEDFRQICITDLAGTNLEDLTLGRDIKDASSFAVVITVDTTGMADTWIRHWSVGKETPVMVWGSAGVGVSSAPYYPQYVPGIVEGIRGGAEYELLLGQPEDALRSTDMLSATHIVVLLLILFGNILYWGYEKRGH